MIGKLRRIARLVWTRSWIATTTSNTRTAMPTQPHAESISARVLLAGPAAHRAGVHVDEARVEVDPDAADLLIDGPFVELLRRDARQEEVDRVALRVMRVARDLVALLAEDQVVLGMPKSGDDHHRVAVKV